MNILLIGATGMVGSRILTEALDGYTYWGMPPQHTAPTPTGDIVR